MNAPFRLLPETASSIAPRVDAVTLALFAVCSMALIILFGLILFFSIRYRKGSLYSRKITWGGKHVLEWAWTFGALFVFLTLFTWGAVVYFEQHVPPAGSAEISVVAKQWMWKFQHPNGTRELNELHVPVGEPIVLTMTSQDVIHSFFVPAFRIKQDVLPDRYTRVWFQASRAGEYHLFCTQYCGTLHSGMRGRVVALSREDYQRWLATSNSGASGGSQLGSLTMASRGRELFTRFGCTSCHNAVAGTPPRAPTLAGIYGRQVGLSDGTSVLVDENYLRESILNPSAKIVQGYPNIMPSFARVASEEDVLDLVAYIKSQGAPQ